MTMRADQRVPGYLGRVLDTGGNAFGTCFQVAPGVLITAWQVLDSLGAGDAGATVGVDGLSGGAGSLPAQVVRVDPVHDLAVLRRAEPLGAVVSGVWATDGVADGAEVVVTGASRGDDPRDGRRCPDALGRWAGGTTRDDQVALGLLSSRSVLPGMSGAPVRRCSDDAVVGVVSGRYRDTDGRLPDSVWVARTEQWESLLAGVARVEVGGRAAPEGAVDLVLTVSRTEVRLHGGGVDLAVAHQGMRPGLAESVHDVRRAGGLLAESFLPGPVSEALAEVLRRAEAGHLPVRVGVAAPEWSRLPWEALPDPASGQALALRPQVALYRKPAAQPVRAIPGPLRIVVAIAAPDTGGAPGLDYERELRNVLAAVRGARAGAARVRVLPFASTTAIRTALAEESAHVLHLCGHGGPGTLVLEDGRGAARPVDADTFVDEAIPADSMPPVISLAGSAAPAEAGTASFADRLVERGASAVIGTGTSVTDRYSTRFFARVYGELAAATVPDVVRAVTDARRTVQRQLAGSPDEPDRSVARLDEWGVVTVLAGSGSVPVFDPAVTAASIRPAPRPAGALPGRAPGEFVGRRDEQRRLPAELLGPATAGVVLHGIGGVGKTTLAVELIRRIFDQEPARVPAVLSGELSVDGVFSTVSGALHRHLLLAGAPGPLLRTAEMAGRVDLSWPERFLLLRDHVLDQVPLLVVLDNFDDNLRLGPDGGYEMPNATLAGLLARWVADPGRSRLLVTSRSGFILPDAAEQHLSFCHLGPLSRAETRKLSWFLPALDRLEEPELARFRRMVGGHPRALEHLDALLRSGPGRYRDVTTRLTGAVHAELGRDEGDRWLATDLDLDTARAESLALAADGILLDELLGTLRATPHAEQLLLGASVYREPVDTNALLFQVGDPDDAAGHTPDRSGAEQRINQILATRGIDSDRLTDFADLPAGVLAEVVPYFGAFTAIPRPPRSTPLDLTRLTGLLARTGLLAVDPEQDTVFVHRWTAAELERRCHDRGRRKELGLAHQRAAEYWRWRVGAWPQGQQADAHDDLEAQYHLLAGGEADS